MNVSKLPQQKLSFKRKSKNWRKEVVDALDKGFSIYHNPSTRINIAEKIINQNLYNGILDTADMAKYLNPYGIVGYEINKKLGHHAIIVPKIDVLVGEESKRFLDYQVIISNPDAISSKIKSLRGDVKRRLIGILEQKYGGENGDENMKARMQEELSKLEKYANYTYKDIKELRAANILKYYENEQNFASIFNDGFKDVLIHAEEVYECAIISDEPKLIKLNPMKVHVVRTSNSSRIEDADVIVIDDHWSPGKIIDTYWNDLKSKDIDHINDYGTSNGSPDYEDQHAQSFHLVGAAGADNAMLDTSSVDDYIEFAEINGHKLSSNYTDEDGNIRVLRVFWRSQRKVLKVKYYTEQGLEEYKIMDETYKIKENMGEVSESLWINEWWEGTKIGQDIYINMQPRKVQYNKLSNPSEGNPGLVGEIYNTNQGRAVSLVSRMKSYQYMYDAIWDRLNKAIAKNMGKILEVDVAKIPNNWDVGKWLHYATTMGIGVVDSFKEGSKGAATGKLAGGFNTTGKVLDVETGSYIQHHITLLEYIKQEMSEIAGITRQREGNISNRETVGGVERSVTQSSHITEWWFRKHTDVKIRALRLFLETAKAALRGNKKKMQNILDDRSIQLFEIDGDEFAESDYDVMITSDQHYSENKQQIQQLAQVAMQGQALKFSDMLYIFNSNSLSDMSRRIEKGEMEQEARASQESQQKSEELAQARKNQQDQVEMANKREDTKIALEAQDIELNRLKIKLDAKLKEMELNIKAGTDNEKVKVEIDKIEKDVAFKASELSEVIRHNKVTETIDKKNKVTK